MYRPVDILDPRNQLVIGRAQKFEADLWQQSRRSLATHFGMSLNDVDAALDALKRLGVIWTELRTIFVKGQRMSNTMYIGLNTQKLLEISTPMVLQTDSYTSGEGELSEPSATAMDLQKETYTEITQKIKKSRSRAATGNARSSPTQVNSKAINEAIASLPLALQRDACQIAHEEAEAGDEVIASNYKYLASRQNLSGGLLRIAVRHDYAAPYRDKMRDLESHRQKSAVEKTALENKRTAEDEDLSRTALEWCDSAEGQKFLRTFGFSFPNVTSEKDREQRERAQRNTLHRQRQELVSVDINEGTVRCNLDPLSQ
jgi:hypothetical protein